jgi:hypothetical protein
MTAEVAMRQMRWTVSVHRDGDGESVPLATFTRSVDGATVAAFGLSLEEGRHLLKVLQQAVVQSQIRAYDSARRCCRHCGARRQIKDWRGRVVTTSLGEVRVRVPRVVSCLCTPEPLDDDGVPMDRQRLSECPIHRLIPDRRTPELLYLCAKHGASQPYRVAAGIVSEVTGLRRPCHMTVRRDTLSCGQQLEDAQFLAGWYAGQRRRRDRAAQLRVAIDGTYLTAAPGEEVTKFEVVAGRVERDGGMGQRFACALPRRSMTRTLVAAALERSGWAPQTEVEVMSDGAKGMRSLVASVAPTLSKPTLDWFHLAMKIHGIRTSLGASTMTPNRRPAFMARSARTGSMIRDLLWRGRTQEALGLTYTLIKSLKAETPKLSPFYASAAETARGAAARLLAYVKKNRADIIDYNQARRDGRRISTAAAESVMNHVINRRMSKGQQMRWSISGAQCLLQTRVALLDDRLQTHFHARFPHFRCPEVRHA